MDYNKTLDEARENNPEILTMEQQLLEAERAVAEARSQKGIRGDLFAQFGLSGVDEDIRSSYSNLTRQQRVEVGVQVPILDWGLGKGQVPHGPVGGGGGENGRQPVHDRF